MARAVLLSGEHATLPLAELRAMVAVRAPGASVSSGGSVAHVEGVDEVVDAAAPTMAYAHAWGEPWGVDSDDEEGHVRLAKIVGGCADGQGAAAVVTTRRGKIPGDHSIRVAKTLGAALANAGHTIDLESPELRVYAWLEDGHVHVGRLQGEVNRTKAADRIPERRGHFHPVGLHPRLATCLVHLARVAPGGTLLDPFCGTGGIALEAALERYNVIASDADEWMVQGTLQTLADAGPDALPGVAFVADIGEVPRQVEAVDGIVTDLPYGRASTTGKEDVRGLYERAFDAFHEVMRPGGRLVVGVADPALLPADNRFELEADHAVYTHKSLTRHFVIMKREGEVDPA